MDQVVGRQSIAGAAQPSGDRSARAKLATGALILLLALASIAALAIGPSDTSLWRATGRLLTGGELSLLESTVLLDIRLPRLAMGLLVGAALAMSGVAMQGLFRNPLADPGLVGVSAGASFGAVTAIVMGAAVPSAIGLAAGNMLVPLAAFVGGFLTTILLYRVATRQGKTSVAIMLLAGIALQALTLALTGIFIFMADDSQLRDITFWNLGSLAGATWPKFLAALPFAALAMLIAPLLARGLNALALGESAAAHLGIAVQRLKFTAVFVVALATGAAVAVSGGIGFIGIVVPHLLRISTGPDHRFLFVNAGLLGGVLLVAADTVARTIVSPAELPIGILTAMIGGPVFIWILMRNRSLLGI
ncbi:MAG: iron ABC transporter permease [Pseudomonadota bacterium]